MQTRSLTRRLRLREALWLGLSVFWALSAGAQERATPAESPEDFAETTFTDIIDVRVVEVEVVVTDKKGNRASGLGAEDFRLLVDGQPTAVEYFSEVRGDALVTAEEDSPGGPEGPGNNGVEPAVWEDPGRSYLVFLDDYFTDRRYRHRLLKNLDKNVEALRPVDRMAVVRFEGYGLEVLAPWTSSKDDLRDALDEARKRTPRELIRQTLAGVSANPVTRSQILARQIEEVANAMAVAMRSFADVPGRKLLLPVTEGWPFDPTLDLSGPGVTAEETRSLQAGPGAETGLPGVGTQQDARTRPLVGSLNPNPNEGQLGTLPTLGEVLQLRNVNLLYPMIDHANLLGYTIYPMHVGTLEIGGGGELERSSLWILARETGGRIATEGAAATLPLEPVVDDTGSYYVLGFSPQRVWDDQRHRVEVELQRDGLEARHRRNFLDLSRAARREMEVEEALLRGEGGDLDVAVGKWRGRQVPVTLRIPMDWVTMVPEGDHYACKLELRVATVDERGGRSEVSTLPINIQGPEPPPGSYATYEARLELRKIEQRVVLYLYDTLSGESKVAGLELSP